MVSSVNPSLQAALLAQEAALLNRSTDNTGAASDAAAPTSSKAQDPAVVYAGTSGAPALSAVLSVQDGLTRAASISDVGINAGQTISSLLDLLKQKIVAAQGAASDADKGALDSDYQQLLQTIDQLAKSAAFGGTTMLDGSAGAGLTFSAAPNSDATLTLSPQDFTVGGPVIGLAQGDLLGSAGDLASLLDQVDSASGALNAQLAQMTAQSQQIQGHLGAVSQLSNALSSSTTPDLDADGARLMALQVQQALQASGQAQSVANQGPQALLSLFRN